MAPALPLTIPHAARLAAERWGDAPALIERGDTWSFNQLLAQCRRATAALLARGIGQGDRIAIWAPNSREWIVAAVGAQNGLVVFDEAYQPFSSRTWLPRAGEHDHVLVMRTLSKFGLAGIRLGYMVGPTALIAEIDKVRPPYNVSVLNAEAALFALEHADEYARQAAVLRSERERLQAALSDMPGVQAWPSEANMILVRVADSKATFEGMKQRGVLIKHVAALHPLLANCLRLTVGTAAENDQLLAALKASL